MDRNDAMFYVLKAASERLRQMEDEEIHNATPSLSDEVQVSLAEQVAKAVIQPLWDHHHAQYGRRRKIPPLEASAMVSLGLPDKAAALLEDLGVMLSDSDLIFAAHEIGQIYTHFLPSSLRAKKGVYYTPPILADRLLDKAERQGVDWRTARVIDPASGAGAFLLPVARRMIAAMTDMSPSLAIRNLRTRLEGWDIDPFSAWISRVFVELMALPLTAKTTSSFNPEIHVRDSLRFTEGFGRYDLVVGNPPFGRAKLDPDQRERFSKSLFGHANLYGIFTELAVDLAKPEGIVAFLTPASFLGGEYFKNLRQLLWREAPPASIDFVASRRGVFEGVLQETLLSTFRKGRRRSQVAVTVVHPETPTVLDIEPAGRFRLPRNPQDPWIIPRNATDRRFVQCLGRLPSRFADWGYAISTGPLVWNRHKPQLSNRASKSAIPIIWSEAVTPDGRFVFRSEKRNHQPYLKAASPKDDWLKVNRACVLLQRTTAKEQRRRLVAAVLPDSFIGEHGCVTVENHLNMIYPVTSRPKVPLATLSIFLNSEAADRAFRCLSGSVAVSAYELSSLPLPSLAGMKKLDRLINRGAGRPAIERACLALFEEAE